MSSVEKIIVFRALKLGDMLCSIPAIRAIRITFPHAHIALAGHPQMAPFISRYEHYIDEFIPFAGFPGMAESPVDAVRVWDTIREIQNKEFDLAIQLHGSGELSNSVITLFNAKSSIGHYRKEHYRPDSKLFKIYPDHLHEVDRCLSLLEVIGADIKDKSLEFKLTQEDERVLYKEFPSYLSLKSKSYICLHPGASSVSKCWSPSKFSLLGDWFIENGIEVVFARYANHLPDVLQGTSFTINAGEKVGVIGRTGAGKSTLFSLLHRFIPTHKGSILIDNTSIDHFTLKELRTSISTIPQSPVLFSGTVRSNLDPNDEFEDEELIKVLFKAKIFFLPDGLDSSVCEGGTNFSRGQRQLLCLARALVRKAKIIIVDEATACIDARTDELIRNVLMNECPQITVLIIAHKMESISECDKIIEMAEGRVLTINKRVANESIPVGA